MARIVITAFGSRGDVNPFVALGKRLKARGHRVTFVLEGGMMPLVLLDGFDVHLLPSPKPSASLNRMMSGRLKPFDFFKASMRDYFLPAMRARIEALHAACKGADLLLAHALEYAAMTAADLTGVKWVSVVLTPLMPSKYVPPRAWPHWLPLPASKAANGLLWQFTALRTRSVVDAPINAIRREYGLQPRTDIFTTGKLSRQLSAMPISEQFMPRPSDWPSYLRMTGFCFWETPYVWEMSPELAAFFAKARPVVAVSFGSMAATYSETESFFHTSSAAVRRAGAGALLVAPPKGLHVDMAGDMAGDVMTIPYAPFSQLYPRCVAAIHHGGIGTTALALATGTPALIVPWGVDQFFNAAQVERIGAGRRLSRERYTEPAAADAVQALLHNPTYRFRTQNIAERIRREDGVATLVSEIERQLG